MKRLISFFLVSILCICLSACGNNVSSNDSHTETTDNISTSELGNQESEVTTPKYQYVGEYEQEPVYHKLKQIENCTDPDTLCRMLWEIYGEEFTYIKLEYDAEAMTYKEPYADVICTAIPFYNGDLYRDPISSDTYLFFMGYSEEPSFVMDCDGTYIVRKYEIKNFDDGTHAQSISSWIITDLFMCLHEYIDEDAEQKAFMRDAVRYMDWYLSFENIVIDSLNGNNGNINHTESLRASIDILSVEITGPTMHELNVKYQIKNISEERGVVYLTCSGHAYQDELHFNDKNFKNDYRQDGYFDYNVYYGGGEKPTTFTIFYGYGEFDPYEGWDNECMTTITLLYTEDYGEISSNTIPSDEIYPLYFEGEYVGAWTLHESRDLIETDGNSTAEPFEKNNTFTSDKGFIISVEVADGTPLFTINGAYVGAPNDVFEYDGVLYYDFWYNDEHISINRYPNDEYLRLQDAWSLVGDGDIYLYP